MANCMVVPLVPTPLLFFFMEDGSGSSACEFVNSVFNANYFNNLSRYWRCSFRLEACALSVDNSDAGRYPLLIHNFSACEYTDQLLPILLHAYIFFHQATDGTAGVQHRGVIAPAEGLADFRQAVFGQFLGQGHGHL